MSRKIIHLNEENYNNFGSLMKIVEYRNSRDMDIYFPEYDWTSYNRNHEDFKRGRVICPYEPRLLNVGYMGEGDFLSKDEYGKRTKEYDLWRAMITRCYDEKHRENYKTYKDCTVCDEWLNFQNAARWFSENYPYEFIDIKWCLDKDILIKGNKEYGPNTCCFVPEPINILFIKSDKARGELPIGVSKASRYKTPHYYSTINKNGKQVHLGTYTSIEEAFISYKEAKEKYIKELANKYAYCLSDNVLNILYNWEIDIND